MKFTYDDAGREAAGYKGYTGDCVTRAICNAIGLDYKTVYDELFDAQRKYAETKNNKIARRLRSKGCSPRKGIYVDIAAAFLKEKGWVEHRGRFKLDSDTFKHGTFICVVRKHFTCVKDGVLFDSYDCQLTSGHFAEQTVKTATRFYTQG